MATFLELCADLARESGAINPAPSTVTGQTGRQKACVEWVRKAWVLIQNTSPAWSWLRAEFEDVLTIGQASYLPAEIGATRFAEWIGDVNGVPGLSLYDDSIGRRDETHLRQMPFDHWRMSYDFRTHDNQRPTNWAIAPDSSLRFGATPDKAYKVRGGYRRTPQVLAADTDVPEMPARFHDMIWQRAIMLMAASDEAVQALQMAQLEFQSGMVNLQRDCLPKFTTQTQGPIDQ